MADHSDFRVRIPADVEREDRILFGLTARQVAILAVAGLVLWAAYTTTRRLVPAPVFLAAAIPVAALAAVLALGRRDGVSLDRLALAALRQARSPRRLVTAPEGVTPVPAWVDPALAAKAGPLPAPLRLPAQGISADGVLDLGADGQAVVAAASTLNFALRTPQEQDALIAGFGRWLNSLTAPVQVLIRAERVDLTEAIAALKEAAPGLPHPALEAAAREHATFLADLAGRRDLLRRQVLLVLREPANGDTADRGRVLRQADHAARALAAADVTVTALDGPRAAAVLAAACGPDHHATTPAHAATHSTEPDASEHTGLGGFSWRAA